MHLSPIRIAAAAAGTGLGLLVALAGGPMLDAGAASSAPSAQAEYTAAIKAVGTKGVHFESTALQNGVSLVVVGDTGTTSGAQQLTVKKGSTTEHMSALVVGPTGYIKGNQAALHNVIGLTSAQAAKYANQWLSFPTSNSSLAELVSGLLNSQVASELQMSGPFTYGPATTVHGQHALLVRGFVSSESGGKVPTVLYVPATGSPLPIQEVTNPTKGSGSSIIQGTVAFTKWGESTNEKPPAHSQSLLKVIPPTSGATSTTAPAGG
jgi:hypothetical protein